MFENMQSLKKSQNSVQSENVKLKTRIQKLEREAREKENEIEDLVF